MQVRNKEASKIIEDFFNESLQVSRDLSEFSRKFQQCESSICYSDLEDEMAEYAKKLKVRIEQNNRKIVQQLDAIKKDITDCLSTKRKENRKKFNVLEENVKICVKKSKKP